MQFYFNTQITIALLTLLQVEASQVSHRSIISQEQRLRYPSSIRRLTRPDHQVHQSRKFLRNAPILNLNNFTNADDTLKQIKLLAEDLQNKTTNATLIERTSFLVPLLILYWHYRYPSLPLTFFEFETLMWYLYGWLSELLTALYHYEYPDYNNRSRVSSVSNNGNIDFVAANLKKMNAKKVKSDTLKELRIWLDTFFFKNKPKPPLNQMRPFHQLTLSDAEIDNMKINIEESKTTTSKPSTTPTPIPQTTSHSSSNLDVVANYQTSSTSETTLEPPTTTDQPTSLDFSILEVSNYYGNSDLIEDVEETRNSSQQDRNLKNFTKFNGTQIEDSVSPKYYLKFVELLSTMISNMEFLNKINDTEK